MNSKEKNFHKQGLVKLSHNLSIHGGTHEKKNKSFQHTSSHNNVAQLIIQTNLDYEAIEKALNNPPPTA